MAYGILATALFGYWLFPTERLKSYIVARMNALVPQLSVTAEQVNLRFPLRIELEQVAWRLEGTPVLSSQRLRVKPAWLSIVREKKRLPLRLTIGSGERWTSRATVRFGR